MNNDLSFAVVAAEQRRCAAMLKGDAVALDTLLEARLAFHHSNGAAEDKPTYLAKVASGQIQYVSIDWDEWRVTDLGEHVALMTGRMTTVVRVAGTEKLLQNRVLQVWSMSDTDWRLIAFQSTPIKA